MKFETVSESFNDLGDKPNQGEVEGDVSPLATLRPFNMCIISRTNEVIKTITMCGVRKGTCVSTCVYVYSVGYGGLGVQVVLWKVGRLYVECRVSAGGLVTDMSK